MSEDEELRRRLEALFDQPCAICGAPLKSKLHSEQSSGIVRHVECMVQREQAHLNN